MNKAALFHLHLTLLFAPLTATSCSADSLPHASVSIPAAPSSPSATSTDNPSATSKTPSLPQGEWRVITDPVEVPLSIAWCPVHQDTCEQAYSPGPDIKLTQLRSSPDRQSIAFFAHGNDGCTIFFCSETSCGPPKDTACNPNNGSLLWLPFGSLLYRGGGGSGISIAYLFSHDGDTLWSSDHVMDELSPSHRYFLVGASSSDQLFADMDRVEIMDLVGARTVQVVEVKAGAAVRAEWLGDRVKLTWDTSTREISLPDAGKPLPNDSNWRPFSQ